MTGLPLVASGSVMGAEKGKSGVEVAGEVAKIHGGGGGFLSPLSLSLFFFLSLSHTSKSFTWFCDLIVRLD